MPESLRLLPAWPDVAAIAERSGYAPNTVRRSLNDLCRLGLLDRRAMPRAPGVQYGRPRFEYRLREAVWA